MTDLPSEVPRVKHPGLFVAFEGPEGAGKSTQVARLVEWLCAAGYPPPVRTREPGATDVGSRIRDLLLMRQPALDIPPKCEALLYAADRSAHVATIIKPALAEGRIVVTDRYMDSSIAYQGMGREIGTDIVELALWATDGLYPNLTVLLNIDPAEGLHRAHLRSPMDGPDRIEAEPLPFHERVQAGFLTLAASAPGRYLVLDATARPDEIAAIVRERVAAMLPPPAQEA